TYGYDAASNLTSYCDAGGTVTYAYDAANRMIGVATGTGSCTAGAIVQPCTQYGYDTINQLTTITYPTSTGWTAAMTYSAAGNETGATYTDGSTTEQALTYAYHQGTNDVPLVQSAANSSTGVTTTYSYDGQNRLLEATTGTASTTDSYAYTGDGNLTTVDLGGTTTTMAYDPANELCWAKSGTSSNACSSAPSGAVTYTYDADGNQTANSAGEAIGYNSLNQTTALKPAGGSTESFAYTGVDSTERTQAGTATFTNNELGVASRTKGSTTAYFTYLPAGKTGRLNSMQVGSSRYYYLYDGLGNVDGLIDGTGTRAATYAFSPYGTTTSSSGTQASTNPFRYEAGYTDTTGFVHFGARYLNPQLGTWTQQDPAQTVPTYQYSTDNPVNGSDPTGYGLLTLFHPQGPFSTFLQCVWTRKASGRIPDFVAVDGFPGITCTI
ncbi:MAG: RHS repeat-associated core domain-containing protein, partial [Acidimicrobiales bacterium]